MNEHVPSVCKTKHSKMKESPVAGHTHTGGTSQRFPSTDDMDVQIMLF